MYDLEFGEGEDFAPTAENLASASFHRWEEPDIAAWWEFCSFAQFMAHLRAAEQRNGITWNRGDAYCPYARGRA